MSVQRIGPVLSYVGICLLFLLVCATFGRHHLLGEGIFWDARVYAHAIQAFHDHADPYALPTSVNVLPFVNPPIFLRAIAAIATLIPGRVGWVLYCCLATGSWLAIPWAVTRVCCPGRWMTAPVACAIFAFQPNFMSEKTMLAGNVAAIIYLAVLLAAMRGFRVQQWWSFYVIVTLAALAKPAFLTFLLLPLLAEEGHLIACLVTVVVSAMGYGLQYAAMRGMYTRFQHAAYYQLAIKRDLGMGPYVFLDEASRRLSQTHGSMLGIVIFGLLAGSLAGTFFLLQRRRRHSKSEPIWIAALLVLSIVLNPRMQSYDEGIAIIPAFFILCECLHRCKPKPANLGWIALISCMLLTVYSKGSVQGIDVLLLTSLVLTILVLLSQPDESHVHDVAVSAVL